MTKLNKNGTAIPSIFFIEKNIRGAWVVCGSEGIKQYYGYSKSEAIRRYKEDSTIFVNVSG